MDFEWSTNDIATMTISIYETNITLNKAACRHFEEVNYVLLGLNKKKNQIGIKPVTKQEINDEVYPKSQLHRISLGKSYGRISNKSFVQDLKETYGFDFNSNQCFKFQATYDVIHSILIAQL